MERLLPSVLLRRNQLRDNRFCVSRCRRHWFRRGDEAGLEVSETSGVGSTSRQLRIRVAWLSPRAGMGCMLSLGLAVLCGANLHEIVERLVEGEGGGGGRGCASGRFALAVAGQACSCRNARHGRRVFVGALVAFLAKKRVKKARGSTTVRIRLFWVCESQIPPKPSWRRARETRRRHRQVGCLLFALGR